MATDERREETALGRARGRFFRGLGQKVADVRALLAIERDKAASGRAFELEEVRLRVHALYASAQVFRVDALAASLRRVVDGLEAIRGTGRGERRLDDLARIDALLADVVEVGRTGSSEPLQREALRSSLAPPRELASDSAGEPLGGPLIPPPPAVPHSVRPMRTSLLRALDSRGVHTLVFAGPADECARVRGCVPKERYEVLEASTADSAMQLVDASAPDLVIVDEALATSLLAKMTRAHMTAPVVVLAAAPRGLGSAVEGAAAVLVRPIDADRLLRTLGRLLERSLAPGIDPLLESTVDEVADRLAESFRAGLVDALVAGEGVEVPLAGGASVLSVTLGAVARVRRELTRRSGRRVVFRESTQPSILVSDMADVAPDGEPLLGRSIVLALPTAEARDRVTSTLLRAGADVYPAEDGVRALRRIRAVRPDAIVVDAWLPGLDGFALGRLLARDPAFAAIPLILVCDPAGLSEGALGVSVLVRLDALLAARARLETKLAGGAGELRGRLDGVGAIQLVRTVARVRAKAHVEVRDAGELFEVDLRDGKLVALSWTTADGVFHRGERALVPLLSRTVGRYLVQPGRVVREIMDEPVGTFIDESVARLSALLETLAASSLPFVERVVIDDDIAASRPSASPVARSLRESLASDGPRALLERGEVSDVVLSAELLRWARRGAVRAVLGPRGEDLVALAVHARGAPEPDQGLVLRSEGGPRVDDVDLVAVRRDPSLRHVAVPRLAGLPVTSAPLASTESPASEPTSVSALLSPSVHSPSAHSSAPSSSDAGDAEPSTSPASAADSAIPPSEATPDDAHAPPLPEAVPMVASSRETRAGASVAAPDPNDTISPEREPAVDSKPRPTALAPAPPADAILETRRASTSVEAPRVEVVVADASDPRVAAANTPASAAPASAAESAGAPGATPLSPRHVPSTRDADGAPPPAGATPTGTSLASPAASETPGSTEPAAAPRAPARPDANAADPATLSVVETLPPSSTGSLRPEEALERSVDTWLPGRATAGARRWAAAAGYVGVLALLAGGAFVARRHFRAPSQEDAASAPVDPTRTVVVPRADAAVAPAVATDLRGPTSTSGARLAPFRFGRTVEGLDAGIPVGPGQGVVGAVWTNPQPLTVRAHPSGERVAILQAGDTLALPAGVYRVERHDGNKLRARFTAVRAGALTWLDGADFDVTTSDARTNER